MNLPAGPTEGAATERRTDRTIPRQILSVEDNHVNQKLIRAILATQGLKVEAADSLEAARAQLAARTFDLILLDLNLPDGSGLELDHELKMSSDTARVPIIVVTAMALESVRNTVLLLGCAACVTKPIQAQPFIKLIHQHLQQE